MVFEVRGWVLRTNRWKAQLEERAGITRCHLDTRIKTFSQNDLLEGQDLAQIHESDRPRHAPELRPEVGAGLRLGYPRVIQRHDGWLRLVGRPRCESRARAEHPRH